MRANLHHIVHYCVLSDNLREGRPCLRLHNDVVAREELPGRLGTFPTHRHLLHACTALLTDAAICLRRHRALLQRECLIRVTYDAIVRTVPSSSSTSPLCLELHR